MKALKYLAIFCLACQPTDDSTENTPTENFKQHLTDPENAFWKTAAPDSFDAVFETSRGEFALRVFRGWAPIGVDRFYNLARAGFYDDSRFFRVRAGFIVQFGIPGDPAISQHWRERAMPDDPVKQSNTRGAAAFAMTGPDTRTTQIYINLDDNSRLDAQGFAPIGRIVEGMDEVVAKIYSEYGEDAGGGMRLGRQDRMFNEGNAHLDRDFPNLDKLTAIRIR